MPAFSLDRTSSGDIVLRNKYGVYSRAELDRQLREGRLTVEELGTVYDLTTTQIVHVLRTLGVTYRNELCDTRVSCSEITPSMHQVLLGTLLGDAYMPHRGLYGLSHGVHQMDYCYHVAGRLHPFIATFGDVDTAASTKKAFTFWTYHHHRVFDSYYDRFYPNGGKKRFAVDTVHDLGPEGLAYWYMDDGKWDPSGAYLCVGKITLKESDILRDVLQSNFGIVTTFQNWDKASGQHVLYIRAESRSAFFSTIDPYIIPEMRYKITGNAPPRANFSAKAVARAHAQLCAIASRRVRYSGELQVEALIGAMGFFDSKSEYIQRVKLAAESGAQVSRTAMRIVPSDAVLLQDFESGKTDDQVAQSYGLGRNRVSVLRRGLGLPRCSIRMKNGNQADLFQ